MAKTHGFDGILKIADTTAVGELQSWNVDVQAMTTAGYSMGQAWEDNEATVKKWSGSAEAYFDAGDAGQLLLSPGDRVELHFYPGGDQSGDVYRSGFAIVSGAPISGSKDGFVTVTFNFVGDGPLSNGTVT